MDPISGLDGAAIMSISAAVVALTQLLKWAGVPDKWGPALVMGLAICGVAVFGFSKSQFNNSLLFDYFVGWIAVTTSAAGVYGFTRAGAEAITRAMPPPGGGAGSSETIKT